MFSEFVSVVPQVWVVLCVWLITYLIINVFTELLKRRQRLLNHYFPHISIVTIIIPANNVNSILLSSISSASTASPLFLTGRFLLDLLSSFQKHFGKVLYIYFTYTCSHIVVTIRCLSLVTNDQQSQSFVCQVMLHQPIAPIKLKLFYTNCIWKKKCIHYPRQSYF